MDTHSELALHAVTWEQQLTLSQATQALSLEAAAHSLSPGMAESARLASSWVVVPASS